MLHSVSQPGAHDALLLTLKTDALTHNVQSVLDVRQACLTTTGQAPGCVTSAAVRANPGLDYLLTREPIDSREIRRIDGSIRRRVNNPTSSSLYGRPGALVTYQTRNDQ